MKSLLVIMAIFLLSACTTTPETKVVKKTKYVYVNIPSEFLKKCKASTPPNRDKYLNSTYQQKEEQLVNYSVDLLNDIKNCNLQLKGIEDFQIKQNSINTKNETNKKHH